MTPKNKQRDGESLSAKFLQQQLDNVLTDLAAQPNQLLLRCVQLMDAQGQKPSFTEKERVYLAEKMIARVVECTDQYFDGSNKDPYKVISGFLPPWDRVFTDMAKSAKNYVPALKL